jgi:hypothetical protein
VNLGPAPVRQVISDLLDRSNLDFTIVSALQNPEAIAEIIVSVRHPLNNGEPAKSASTRQTAAADAASSSGNLNTELGSGDGASSQPVAFQVGTVEQIGPDTEVAPAKDIPVVEADDDDTVSKPAKKPVGAPQR